MENHIDDHTKADVIRIKEGNIFEKISIFKDNMKEAKEKLDTIYKTFNLIENRERVSDSDELF